MCGVELMNVDGASSAPSSTRDDQNCRLCWNCSLIRIAFVGSTVPSGPSGV
jgi:hypothetical protein